MKINSIKKITCFGIPQNQYVYHKKTHYPSLLREDIKQVEDCTTIPAALKKMGYKLQYESHTSGLKGVFSSTGNTAVSGEMPAIMERIMVSVGNVRDVLSALLTPWSGEHSC